VSLSDSNVTDIPDTPETSDTLDTVGIPDPNVSDTNATPETPETPETLDTAEAPDQTPPTPPINLDIIIKKIRTILSCSHDIHYFHWLIFARKIGCPICDSWLVVSSFLAPTPSTTLKFVPMESPLLYTTKWLRKPAYSRG
jgi:hypothetical protein